MTSSPRPLAVGDRVIIRIEDANGAIGIVRKIYTDSDAISVAVSKTDPALEGTWIVAPSGYVHIILAPGEWERFGITLQHGVL